MEKLRSRIGVNILKPDEHDKEIERFIRIPMILIDSGLLSIMKRSEINVYVVICRYAHFKTGNAFPAFKRIVKESGVNKNLVGQHLKN